MGQTQSTRFTHGETMNLRDILRGIQFIGLGNILRTLAFTRRKVRIDRRHLPHEAPASAFPPGKLKEAESIPSGAAIRFQSCQLEIYFLAPDLVRLTWQPGELPLPYALSDVDWPGAEVQLEAAGEGWRVSSAELVVHVEVDGSVGFTDASGNLLRQDQPPERHGVRWRHRSELRPDERIYGLGERAAPLNLRPGEYRMWNRDPGGSYGPGADPLYLCIPVYLALHEAGSHLTFFENSFDARFEIGELLKARFDDGCLRSYFIPGPPDRALQRYADLTGHAPMPPRWSLGYHQSRWSYMNEGEVRELVENFRLLDLPLDAVHLDIHYMRGYRVFSVDPKRFPDLKGLSADLAQAGVRLVAIIDPGVKADARYPVYKEAKQRGFFCKLPNGSDLLAPVWPGTCSFPDFTNPQVRAWWASQYPQLLQQGIAGIWHDMNEPATFVAWGDPTFPHATQHHMENRGGDHREAHNIYGLLMNQAGFEAQRMARPEKRPFLLTRSGWAGVQRHAWAWTADIDSTWESLRQTIPGILGLSLSGVPYSGPDIGGFSGDPSAELFLRWFQMAAFTPFFRTHSSLTSPRREPWCFGEQAIEITREFLRLRQRLMPYIYTLAWEANQSGQPLVRPLFWPSGDDPSLWDEEDSFMLGESLLVAPIMEAGAQGRNVRLPSGAWYDFWTDELLQGPAEIVRETGLERIPLLVRAGSLLPTHEDEILTLHLYPAEAGETVAHLYSDSGDGYGPSRLDQFHIVQSKQRLTVSWETSGEFAFPHDGVVIHVHGWEPKRCEVNGKQMTIDGSRIHLRTPFKRLILER